MQENHNYITIRGYYNGPDYSVAKQGPLYMPTDLAKATYQGNIDEATCQRLLNKVKENLRKAGYDGSLLKANDLLLAIDSNGMIMNNSDGGPEVILCNFELVWKMSGTGVCVRVPSTGGAREFSCEDEQKR